MLEIPADTEAENARRHQPEDVVVRDVGVHLDLGHGVGVEDVEQVGVHVYISHQVCWKCYVRLSVDLNRW